MKKTEDFVENDRIYDQEKSSVMKKRRKTTWGFSRRFLRKKNIGYPFFWRLKSRETAQKAKKAAILTQTTLAPAGVDQA